MPEIFIHIGLHKTGTTALQTFLATNEKIFNQAGVYFPKATREKKPGQIIHSNLSWELLGHDMFDPGLGTFEQLLAEIRSGPDAATWLITGEGLSRLRSPFAFVRAFAPHPVTILAYLRDPVEAAPSLYTEELKAGCDLTFDEWIDFKASRWLNHQTMMRPWQVAGLRWPGRLLHRVKLYQASRKFSSESLKVVTRKLGSDPLHNHCLMQDLVSLLGMENRMSLLNFKPKSGTNARITEIECLGLVFLNHLHKTNSELSAAQKVKDRQQLRKALLREFPAMVEKFECTPAQRIKLVQRLRQNLGEVAPSGVDSSVGRNSQAPDEWLKWLSVSKKGQYTEALLASAVERASLFHSQQSRFTLTLGRRVD